VHGGAVADRGGEDVDAFRDLGTVAAQQVGAE
jgi:hypothetical protein